MSSIERAAGQGTRSPKTSTTPTQCVRSVSRDNLRPNRNGTRIRHRVTDPRDARWSMSVDSGNKTAECIDFGNLVLIILRRGYTYAAKRISIARALSGRGAEAFRMCMLIATTGACAIGWRRCLPATYVKRNTPLTAATFFFK